MQRLSQEEGVNLAGIKRVIELEHHVEALRRPATPSWPRSSSATRQALAQAHDSAVASLRRDLVPLRDSALVVWKPAPRS